MAIVTNRRTSQIKQQANHNKINTGSKYKNVNNIKMTKY
jgi:hypothetical protein